ncbi:MAG: RHS repeat-associated core domain-containing protein [Spirochaetaceae bacterium]|jgi:RHS repeat-associated protein|nr:RHS repeat-associated core domain-containing protein [Spirochaetaceae bacterium]
MMYRGRKIDWDNGLYYFNARWYDPQLGRFITEDPIKDGLNWFAYANNNPLRYTDPTGLVATDSDQYEENKSYEAENPEQIIGQPWPDTSPASDENSQESGPSNQGAELTQPEVKLQKIIGGSEMVFGGVGGLAAAEISGGASVKIGLFVMADGVFDFLNDPEEDIYTIEDGVPFND